MTPGNAGLVAQGNDESVVQLLARVREQVSILLEAERIVRGGLTIFGVDLLHELPQEFSGDLEVAKQFLEGLQKFNKASKWRNFDGQISMIQWAAQMVVAAGQLQKLGEATQKTYQLAQWASDARATLGGTAAWTVAYRTEVGRIIADLKVLPMKDVPKRLEEAVKLITGLKDSYALEYMQTHKKYRLSHDQERQRNAILDSSHYRGLRQLCAIELLPAAKFHQIDRALTALVPCNAVSEQALKERTPFCTKCELKPADQNTNEVRHMLLEGEQRIDQLLDEWSKILLDEFARTPERKELLTANHRIAIDAFVAQREFPQPMTHDFLAATKLMLSELVGIPLTSDRLIDGLKLRAGPVTIEDLNQRFADLMHSLRAARDMGAVRIIFREEDLPEPNPPQEHD